MTKIGPHQGQRAGPGCRNRGSLTGTPPADGDTRCSVPRAPPSAAMDGAGSVTPSPSSNVLFPLGFLSCRACGRTGMGRRCWVFKWRCVSQGPAPVGGRAVNAEQTQPNNCPPAARGWGAGMVCRLLCACLGCFLGRRWARRPLPPPPPVPAAPPAWGLLDISVWAGGSQAQDGCGGLGVGMTFQNKVQTSQPALLRLGQTFLLSLMAASPPTMAQWP